MHYLLGVHQRHVRGLLAAGGDRVGAGMEEIGQRYVSKRKCQNSNMTGTVDVNQQDSLLTILGFVGDHR